MLLTGSEAQHGVLRHMICDYIAEHHSQLYARQDYLSTSNMRDDGVWATDTEILALASLLRCDVYVYSSAGSQDGLRYEPTLHLPSPMTLRATSAMYINRANENHYEPVVFLSELE